jgi:ABC-type transport system involved in multi-copper enzyme maturation permease subunit
MTFLPIVARELRVASRRRWTYWGRFSAALLAVIAMSLVLLLGRLIDPREIGSVLFDTVAMLGFFCIAIFGTQLTCGCLSTERREGTMGLLFLTDLRGYDVVFGKLAATSFHAAYNLLSVLPVLAIPLLLGGVTGGEEWRVALVSANLLFFFLSVGMFSSSVCRQDHRALALAVFISLTALLFWPLLDFWLSLGHSGLAMLKTQPGFDPDWLLSADPAYGCITAFEDNYRTGPLPPSAFWWNAAITQLYSWICLLLACWIVPRSWQETHAGPKRGKWRDQWRAFSQGGAAARAAVRRKWLAINPFLWRAGRPRIKHIAPWALLALAAALWYFSGKLMENDHLFDEPNDILWACVLHFIFKVWVASEACRCFAEDRRSGALELLLTTPLSEEQIVRGQRKALWRQFAPPVAAVLLLDLLFLNRALRYEASRGDSQGFILLYLVAGAFFVMDMYAMSWLSMRLGLTGRKPVRIIMLSFWWAILLPGIVSIVITYAYLILTRREPTPLSFALVWAIPSLTADLIVFATGRFNILKRFREGDVERAGAFSPAQPAR